MSIRVGNFKVVYISAAMKAIDPQYLGITRDDIAEYMESHTFPDDPAYSLDDMIGDITGSSRFYTLPDKIQDKTANFIADLISDLI